MRKLLSTIAILASAALAQIGIVSSNSGIHAPTAKTLGQGFLYVSGSFEMVSDGKALSLEGSYRNYEGNNVDLDANTPSNDEALTIGFGFLDNLDLGIRLPFHYDGEITDTDLQGFALGDIQLISKGAISINEWLTFGVEGEIIIPSGSKAKGFRPRHRWYVHPNSETYAFTSNGWGIVGNSLLSVDFKHILVFNGYAGLLRAFKNDRNYILWGGGFNLFPEKILTAILEVSGETPVRTQTISRNILSSPFRFTPGLRLHLPQDMDLTISADVGLNYFREDTKDILNVNLKSGSNDINYTVSGSPNISVAVTLSKTIDFSWSDADGDGVIDRHDMCPGTERGLIVNNRGCPVDEDQDGVLNIVDLCPGTLLGLQVDYNGCPLDLDKDGVFDYLDKCLNTPEGFAVNADGCTKDTDQDGIDDNNDKCPNSRLGDKVDNTGCPLDEDHDGIPNNVDKCPNTPEGISIDNDGCPLDFDKDGVPDDLDKCPNSRLGEIVNETGCPADEDNDGVPDSKDLCPQTPKGVMVTPEGCRMDQDGDGIFDEEDKCPNTPKGAPIDSIGCPIDTDKDGIADWFDQCPGTLQGFVVDQEGCPVNSRMNFNLIASRIHFKGTDTTLINSSYTALNDIISFMRQYPISLEIQCSAKADRVFDTGENLSEARARMIFDYVEKKGINANRLKYQGFGRELPKININNANNSHDIRLIPYIEQE